MRRAIHIIQLSTAIVAIPKPEHNVQLDVFGKKDGRRWFT